MANGNISYLAVYTRGWKVEGNTWITETENAYGGMNGFTLDGPMTRIRMELGSNTVSANDGPANLQGWDNGGNNNAWFVLRYR